MKMPVWTIMVRETKRLAAPTMEGIVGPLVPLFTSEDLADAVCELEPGLDPVRIDHRETLVKLLRAARKEGCQFVSRDNVVGDGCILPIGQLLGATA